MKTDGKNPTPISPRADMGRIDFTAGFAEKAGGIALTLDRAAGKQPLARPQMGRVPELAFAKANPTPEIQETRETTKTDAGRQLVGALNRGIARFESIMSQPDGLDVLSISLLGKEFSKLSNADKTAIKELGASILHGGLRSVSATLATNLEPGSSIPEDMKDRSFLPNGVNGAFVGAGFGGGQILISDELRSAELSAVLLEEIGEAVASQAQLNGVNVADGDAGARLVRAIFGEAISPEKTPQLYADKPSDSGLVTLNGQTLQAEFARCGVVSSGNSGCGSRNNNNSGCGARTDTRPNCGTAILKKTNSCAQVNADGERSDCGSVVLRLSQTSDNLCNSNKTNDNDGCGLAACGTVYVKDGSGGLAVCGVLVGASIRCVTVACGAAAHHASACGSAACGVAMSQASFTGYGGCVTAGCSGAVNFGVGVCGIAAGLATLCAGNASSCGIAAGAASVCAAQAAGCGVAGCVGNASVGLGSCAVAGCAGKASVVTACAGRASVAVVCGVDVAPVFDFGPCGLNLVPVIPGI